MMRQERRQTGWTSGQTVVRGGTTQSKKKQRPLLVEIFEVLPATYKGIVIGLLLSIIPAISLSASETGDMKILAIFLPLVFSIVGFLIGALLSRKA